MVTKPFKTSIFLLVWVFFSLLSAGLKTAAAEDKGEIYLLKGLYYNYYQVEEAAKIIGLPVRVSYFNQTGGVTSLKPAFPEDIESLANTRLIVLADVDSESLGFRGRQILEKAVRENGAGLLVFGEYFAFGGGDYVKSAIEKMLPVTMTGTYDLQKSSAPLVLNSSSSAGLFKDLSWSEKSCVLWYHRLVPRVDSEVAVRMGSEPFLVIRQYGAGKVGVITGTVLGKKEGPMVPFWEWKDWTKFMGGVINLLIRQNPPGVSR